MRYAASPAFVRALAERYLTSPKGLQSLRRANEGVADLDFAAIESQHGKTFARSLRQHEILGVGANGVVLQSRAEPDTVLKIQAPINKGAKGRLSRVEDEVNIQALAAELGAAPQIRAYESYPSGASVIEMEKVSPRHEVQFRDKDLAVAMAELDLIGQGIIHKDVHPGNVAYDPTSRRVKFMDFGAASVNAEDASLYRQNAIVRGMQAMGNVDEAEIFRQISLEHLTRRKASKDPAEKARAAAQLDDLLAQGEQIVLGAVDADLDRPYTSLAEGRYPNAWREQHLRAPRLN